MRIYPHGVNEANAYYSRELRALVFGYFSASLDDAGPNIPGQPVFTCLSHDIIVHETCHAIIDGMREYFLEPTNRDTLAFHEALSDVIAMLQHFTFPEPLLDTIQRTGGRLYLTSLEPELDADSQGASSSAAPSRATRSSTSPCSSANRLALAARCARRSARRPNKRDIETVDEPHERGAILVAAIFEAFFRVYARRTRDLFRLAGVGAGPPRRAAPGSRARLCGGGDHRRRSVRAAVRARHRVLPAGRPRVRRFSSRAGHRSLAAR